MSGTRVAAVLAVIALAIPAMAFGQAPVGAWCAGSYGAEGTNFGPCPTVESAAQVAGQASGVQGLSAPAEPQFPATNVMFENGKAYYNKQELNLNFKVFPDRTHEIEAGDSGGATE